MEVISSKTSKLRVSPGRSVHANVGLHESFHRGEDRRRLLSGSGVAPGPSHNQAGDENAEQGFAAPVSVVRELKQAEIG